MAQHCLSRLVRGSTYDSGPRATYTQHALSECRQPPCGDTMQYTSSWTCTAARARSSSPPSRGTGPCRCASLHALANQQRCLVHCTQSQCCPCEAMSARPRAWQPCTDSRLALHYMCWLSSLFGYHPLDLSATCRALPSSLCMARWWMRKPRSRRWSTWRGGSRSSASPTWAGAASSRRRATSAASPGPRPCAECQLETSSAARPARRLAAH